MTNNEYGTIRIPRDAYEEHNQERKANGQTWEEYINTQAPENTTDIDAGEIADELRNELSMANEPGVDVDIERLMGRIDELEAQLPDKVGENVEGRLR